MTDSKLRPLRDFTNQIYISDTSYECSSLDTMDKCQNECLNEVGNYFNNQDIKRPDPEKLNTNIFLDNENAATKVCNLLNERVSKPGEDIYALWNNGLAKRSLALGRLCCQPSCSCEYVFRYVETNDEVIANEPIPLPSSMQPLNQGYECSNELSDCMTFCRQNAFHTIKLWNSTFDMFKQTLTNLDVFRDEAYMFYMCNTLIRKPSSGEGFNIFYRYTQNQDYPFKEDFHIGRLCCLQQGPIIFGLNRCQ